MLHYLGTTWLKVPETVLIEFVGNLKWGFVGKDVMLYILKQFKRNTVALDRVRDFTVSYFHPIHPPVVSVMGKWAHQFFLFQLFFFFVFFLVYQCVEFGGNIGEMDLDSRFAISNMSAEFGAVAGIFPADELTQVQATEINSL